VGYVAGGGPILKTINGGESWTALSSGTTNGFSSVFFPDPNKGYAVGTRNIGNMGYATIIKTTDAGASWDVLNYVPGFGLISVYFTDANTGYAVGMIGTIIKTEDGGVPVGTGENKSVSLTLKLYPNPASHNLTIETVEKGVLSVYNLNGTLLLQQEIMKPNATIDVSNLPNGLYVLKVVREKEVEVGKFIKE